MVSVGKWIPVIVGIVFVVTAIPIAFDEISALAVAYPEYATILGLVSLAIVFGLVYQALKGTGISMK